ncbi:MAG: cytochrome P460 family protein, partial [Alphaproteobacteria bacterium]|nr:cytochrome P460 family protein [Alphaproteobacteria bacterium]
AKSALGRKLPGKMKAIAVMERRDGWGDQYEEGMKVGNWEFEVFSPDGKNLNKDISACRACHQPLNRSEFMFSLEHLIAAQ